MSIAEIIGIAGIPTAVTAFCFWLIERRIQKRETEAQEKAAAREKARENLQIITIQSVNAAIALSEATARAVQRIPDAHCNGDMHAALNYAADVKHKQKDFLTAQGIHSIVD